MTQLDRSDERDKYIAELRVVESLLGSVEMSGFIQTQNQQNSDKFFELKNKIAIFSSQLERERLDAIALQLEQLGKDFSEGTSNLKNALNDLNNTTEIFRSIDMVIGILARIII